MNNMKVARGTIVLVQEHRFQLMHSNGKQQLFTLAHGAPQEWRDLKRLEKENCLVQVAYTESDKLQAATAHDIEQQS